MLEPLHQFEQLSDALVGPLGVEEVRRALRQEHVAHQLPFANLRDDAKRLRDSAQPTFFLQEPLGKRMVGQHKALARRQLVFQLDTIQHFTRRLFGERQQQDLLGRHALPSKPAVTLDQDSSLAGPSARHDQQRSLGVRHRRLLGVGQPDGVRDHRDGPAWRKRISRTTGAPIISFSLSIRPRRSRWSWWASGVLLAVTHSVPPRSIWAAVSLARSGPTS